MEQKKYNETFERGKEMKREKKYNTSNDIQFKVLCICIYIILYIYNGVYVSELINEKN